MRLITFILALSTACAPGADGLRQACANADGVLGAGYRSFSQAVSVQTNKRTTRLSQGEDPQKVDADVRAAAAVLQKVLNGLDAAADAMGGVCQAPDVVDASKNKDWAALIAALAPVVANVTAVVNDLAPLLKK